MQDRECIAFERTRDTDQRIHESCACLWVPCSSRLQPIVGWIIFILCDNVISHICPLELVYCMPLKKIITRQNFLCLWSKIILKASLAHHKINFVSFKKKPNISLYVEYSQTFVWFFEDFKFAYKTTNFTQNDLSATSDKNTNFNISKNLLRKGGISNSLL